MNRKYIVRFSKKEREELQRPIIFDVATVDNALRECAERKAPKNADDALVGPLAPVAVCVPAVPSVQAGRQHDGGQWS
jgi:hypothetical protein